MRLGMPQGKSSWDKIDICVVLASFLCLVASICVITPRLTLSWQLQFNRQIIIIGFLLSLMNLSLRRIAPTLFLISELRWGGSSLQNYDAILRNSISLSETGYFWRITVLSFILLPLGLSVAYKRFTGGTSSAVIGTKFPGRYGLAVPPLGDFTAMNNSVYFAIDANVPFMAASSSDSIPPPFESLPIAYGYNTLLLDNGSAALLDMPLPEYILSIQQNLKGADFWNISATVNATVARYNTSTEAYRNDDSFWQETIDSSWSGGLAGLSSFELFNGNALGLLPGIPNDHDGAYCLTGTYNSTLVWVGFFNNLSSPDVVALRSAALMFNIRREICAGKWQINRTAIVLLEDSCTGIETNQGPLSTYVLVPFPLDALPVLVHALTSYSADRSQSAWHLSVFVTAIATSYWARLAFMVPGQLQEGSLKYPPTHEYITSTTTTLDATWLLYFLLAFQPVLTLLMFLSTTLLYSSPIGKGFGLVAVLSGIDSNCLNLLSGAGFSGELKSPVKLNISVVNDTNDSEGNQRVSPTGRIEYTIDRPSRRNT
ncbi:hypothetical protein BGZ57DRAFT_773581 [Hyaloscypha finlandica]|nr:hypothetical protein BGZ57DRAFT_773581 [Hyaloscypha finlandica]